jgi:hypothetical protein
MALERCCLQFVCVPVGKPLPIQGHPDDSLTSLATALTPTTQPKMPPKKRKARDAPATGQNKRQKLTAPPQASNGTVAVDL